MMTAHGTRRGAISQLRIIVLGYLIRGPLGGYASYHLQYLIGLARLGHDVYFIEDSDDYASCYDPVQDTRSTDPTYGLKFASRLFNKAGFGERWAYYDAHTSRWLGPCADSILNICESADLLVNVGGANPLRSWLKRIPVRAFIDLDPVFTQVRHLTDPAAQSRALQHTSFFSVGENIGLAQSTIPDDGFPWQPTRQPIVLDEWQVTPGPANGFFTTVMLWDSYPRVNYCGVRYGMKSESFQPYMDLPEKAGHIFELAVGSSTSPHVLLREKGWAPRDSRVPTRTLSTYQRYIQKSKAEFSIAKHGYVVSRSGWFGDRTAAYLAAGRPVLLQETGYSDWLPTGSGIIPFRTPPEALAGIEAISSRYDFHCRAARSIAEEYLDSRKVLSYLIDRMMTRSHSPGTVHRGVQRVAGPQSESNP